MFKIIYTLFVTCVCVYVHDIGLFLTPRQLAAIIMFLVCLYNERSLYFDKYFNIYFLFVFVFFINSVITGDIGECIRRILGDYFVAYVAVWSTKILFEKRNNDLLFYIFIILGVIDAIITSCQFFGLHIFDPILAILHMDASFEITEMYTYGMLGKAVPGIFGDAVTNGHFLMMCCIISLSLSKYRINFLTFVVFGILLIGCFFAQERSGFYLAVLSLCALLFKSFFNSNRSLALIALAVPLLLLLSRYFFSVVDFSETRFGELGTDLTGRNDIYRGAWAYISDNPIICSCFEYMRLYGRMPHNLILSAFIYGGLFGGLIIIILLFKQLKVCVRHYFNNNFSLNLRLISMAVAYCAIVADGMVHNLSIVNGDIIGWLIWSTLLGYASKQREEVAYLSNNRE